MKSPFPNPLELTVASALLLLSTTPPSICAPPKRCFEADSLKDRRKGSDEERSVSAESKSSGSSSLTSDGSTADVRELQIRRLNLQVARKSRSKVCVISDSCWKTNSGSRTAEAPSASEITEVSSVSNISSAASSSARSRYVTDQPKRMVSRDDHKRKHVGSTHMRRKAQSILTLLSCGSSSEVKIRQLLGDSPDTSKALRMLLKREEVRRYGSGGRIDPYVYTVNTLHSSHMDRV